MPHFIQCITCTYLFDLKMQFMDYGFMMDTMQTALNVMTRTNHPRAPVLKRHRQEAISERIAIARRLHAQRKSPKRQRLGPENNWFQCTYCFTKHHMEDPFFVSPPDGGK